MAIHYPAHPLSYTGKVQLAVNMGDVVPKKVCANSSMESDSVAKLISATYTGPVRGVETQSVWSDKFLQGPASGEPPALMKLRLRFNSAPAKDIGEKYIANLGSRIPPKHRVDSLGQLSTARLVDADCVTRIEFSGAICPTLILC